MKETKNLKPVPGSQKVSQKGDEEGNPNIVAVPKKLLQIIVGAIISFIVVVLVYIIYSAGQSAKKDGIISKLEGRLEATVLMLCNKEVDEIAFVKKKNEDGKMKIHVDCNPESK